MGTTHRTDRDATKGCACMGMSAALGSHFTAKTCIFCFLHYINITHVTRIKNQDSKNIVVYLPFSVL